MHKVWICCIALVASGCATTRVSSVSPMLALNAFDTPSSRPDICLTGGLEGRLTTVGRCVVVIREGKPVTPLWPVGTQMHRDKGTTTLSLPDERGVVTLESNVVLGGGAADRSAALISDQISTDCPDEFFSVGTAS